MNTKRIVSLIVLIACLFTRAALAQMHSTPAMTVRQFSGAASGQPVQLAVRVENLSRATMHAQILERRGDGVYAATSKHLTLYFPDGTPVVMGSASDVTPGAILFVYGVVTKKDNADVKRVVVMTRYVRVR